MTAHSCVTISIESADESMVIRSWVIPQEEAEAIAAQLAARGEPFLEVFTDKEGSRRCSDVSIKALDDNAIAILGEGV